MPATVTRKVTSAPSAKRPRKAMVKRRLQHAQHGEAGQRGDEGRRGGQHQPRHQRREQPEQDGEQADHDARRVLRAPLAARR